MTKSDINKRTLVSGIIVCILFAGAILLIWQARGRMPQKSDGRREALVLAGGTMRGAVEEMIKAYGKEYPGDLINTSYGDSGAICAQIQNSTVGEIYIAHDPYMEWAFQQKLVSEWATLANLEVVMIVQKGNPDNIRTLEDLGKPGLRVGIGDQKYSTSGQVVKALMKNLPNEQDIRKNIRLESKGHQQRCDAVAMGTLDASLVWNAVAKMYCDRIEIIPIPRELIQKVDTITSATYKESDIKNIKVAVGLIADRKNSDTARRFYDFIKREAPPIMLGLGFSPASQADRK